MAKLSITERAQAHEKCNHSINVTAMR